MPAIRKYCTVIGSTGITTDNGGFAKSKNKDLPTGVCCGYIANVHSLIRNLCDGLMA